MPPKTPRFVFMLLPEERERLRQQADAKGLSLSNFIRKRLGLKPLHHGAEKQNKRNPFGRAGKKEEA